MVAMYFFETYLDIRQYGALKLSNLPAPLKGVVSQEKFEKARAYSLDKRFVFLLCCCTCFLYFNSTPHICSSPHQSGLITLKLESQVCVYIAMLLYMQPTVLIQIEVFSSSRGTNHMPI